MRGSENPKSGASESQVAAVKSDPADGMAALYEKVLSATPDLIYVFDLNHRFLFANSALLHMWGKTWEEAKGKNCLELGYEQWHAEMHDREIETVISTKRPIRGEVPFTGTDGRRDYDYIFVPILDSDGEVTAVAGTTRDISERKKVEAQLQGAVEFDEAIMMNMNEGLYTVDPKGSIVTMNSAAERLFGIKLDDVKGQNFHDVVHYLKPDGSPFPAADCETLNALSSGESITNRPEVFVRGDGELFDAIYSASPITVDGVLTATVVVFRDVTEEKRIEDELRSSEARIRIAVEAAQQVTWEWDLVNDLIFWNDPHDSVFGKTRLNNPATVAEFFNVLHTGDVAPVRLSLEAAIAHKSIIDLDFRSQRIDGTYRWISVYGQVTQFAGEKPVRLSGVASDVTQKKNAEDALRSSELKLRETVVALQQKVALIELSNDPIFAWDPNDGIVDWNQGAAHLYGFSREEAIGKLTHHLLQTVHGCGIEEFETELFRRGAWTGEITHTAKDGRRIIVESRQQVIESDGKKLVLESNRDVTERRRTEALLERYRLLSEGSRDAIWFLTPDSRFAEVNQAAIDLYGYTREEFLQMELRQIREASTLTELDEQFKRADDRGVHFETLHVKKDGTVFPVDVTANGADFDGERLVLAIVRDISDRKKSENDLRASEERRKLAQEAGRVGIWDWDAVTNRTYWSETMWSFYDEKPADINPDDAYWSAHLHPSDRERVKIHMAHAFESEEMRFHDEFRIVRKNGEVRWLETSANIDRDGDGKVIRMYGVNLDITDRKDTEERIRLSENQLRLVTNAVPALISYVDSNERYRFVNHQFNDWFGIPADEIVGQKVRDIFGIHAYRVVKPKIDEALTGKQVSFETALTYKAAGTRYVHISYMPDIGMDGTVYGYYGLTNDLTDLKRSQDLLRSTEERMALMVENVSDYAIFSMDTDGRIDTWNTGAEIIYGYQPSEIIGRTCDILFPPEDISRGVFIREMRTARQKGKASDDRWHVRKDGTRFFSSGVMMPLRVGENLSGFAKITTDLTEKQRRSEELQKAHDELELRVKERTLRTCRIESGTCSRNGGSRSGRTPTYRSARTARHRTGSRASPDRARPSRPTRTTSDGIATKDRFVEGNVCQQQGDQFARRTLAGDR
ncbi:MAG: PAS domain S-box protein [Pyrinomonadaceae bacterium]